MRKALVFVSAFVLVLVAGAAFAYVIDQGGDETAVGEPGDVDEPTTTVEEKHDEPESEPSAEYDETVEEPVDHEEEKEVPVNFVEEEEPEEKEEVPDEEKDTNPPDIEIRYPEDGQHFETREIVVEGKAEEGAHVYVGKYDADTDDDGNFRIVLILTHDGANGVEVTAEDASGNIASDRITAYFDGPKEEKPKDEPKEVGIEVHQKYGSCAEDVPYEKFLVAGPKGTHFEIYNDWGYVSKELPEAGEYWMTFEFPDMPCGEHGILVKVNGDIHEDYGFVHICEEGESKEEK